MGVTIEIKHKVLGDYIIMTKAEWRKLLAWLAEGESPITNKSSPVFNSNYDLTIKTN